MLFKVIFRLQHKSMQIAQLRRLGDEEKIVPKLIILVEKELFYCEILFGASKQGVVCFPFVLANMDSNDMLNIFLYTIHMFKQDQAWPIYFCSFLATLQLCCCWYTVIFLVTSTSGSSHNLFDFWMYFAPTSEIGRSLALFSVSATVLGMGDCLGLDLGAIINE